MSKEKHGLEKKSKIKLCVYKFKYIIVFIILIIMALLINNIYTTLTSIEIGKVSSKEYELLTSNNVLSQGKVIVKYKDLEGNELQKSLVLIGTVGDEYETQRKEISSYKAHGYDPINKIGNFDVQDTEVVYLYEKENDDINIINEDNVITVQVIKGQKEKYKEMSFSIITKSETGEILKGAKYMVTDVNSAVIRNATSYSDKLLVGSLTIAEEGKDTFNIKQVNSPDGYDVMGNDVKLDVVKTLNSSTGEMEVSLEHEEYKNVDISIENGEIVVIVVNEKTQEPENPPVEPEDPPVEPEDPPVEPEDPPVEPEDPPVEPEDPPVEPENPPVESEDPSMEPEDSTVEPAPPAVDSEESDEEKNYQTGEVWYWAPQALLVMILGVCVVLILKKFNKE